MTKVAISKADVAKMDGSAVEMVVGDYVVTKYDGWVQADAKLTGGHAYRVVDVLPGFGEVWVKLKGFGDTQFPGHIFERAPWKT